MTKNTVHALFTHCSCTVYALFTDLTILFTYLKIIFLQYFQFSISTTINESKLNLRLTLTYFSLSLSLSFLPFSKPLYLPVSLFLIVLGSDYNLSSSPSFSLSYNLTPARYYNFLIFLILSLLRLRLTLSYFSLSLSLSFLSFSKPLYLPVSLFLTVLGSDYNLSSSPFFSLSYNLTPATSVDSGSTKLVKKMRSSLWFVGLCCWSRCLGCDGSASVAGFR